MAAPAEAPRARPEPAAGRKSGGAPKAGAGTRALRALGRGLQRLPRPAALVLALSWMGLIWWLSSIPATPTGKITALGYALNLGHAPLFGLLALWLALALPRRAGWPRLDRRGATLVLACVLAFGLADELHQHFLTRGRDLSAMDVVTDLAGAAGVLWVATYVERARARDAGLLLRLLAAAALCLAAAALATWGPRLLPGIEWL